MVLPTESAARQEPGLLGFIGNGTAGEPMGMPRSRSSERPALTRTQLQTSRPKQDEVSFPRPLSSELGPKRAELVPYMVRTVNSPFPPASNFPRPQYPQCKIPDALS